MALELFDVAHYVLWQGHADVGRLIALSRAFYGANELCDSAYGLARATYGYYRRTRLQHAAAVGNTSRVKLLLDAHADVHADNDYALALALKNVHVETARLLVARGASAAKAVDCEHQPLIASPGTDADSFRALLRELAAPPNVSFADALIVALVNHDAERVTEYVEVGLAEMEAHDATPNHYYRGYMLELLYEEVVPSKRPHAVATVRALLAHRSFDAEDALKMAGILARAHNDGISWVSELCRGPAATAFPDLALWASASAGLVPEAEALLLSGADPMRQLLIGGEDCAIITAGNEGHRAVVELLAIVFWEDNENGDIVLLAAAACGADKLVAQLLGSGAFAGWNDNMSDCPLTAAIRKGHIETVHVLLANPSASLAPYFFAIEDGNNHYHALYAWEKVCSAPNATVMAKLLLEHGALATSAALIGAAGADDGTHVLTVLLDGGGDACCAYNGDMRHISGTFNTSPLHAAAAAGCLASVSLLCERGANLETEHVSEQYVQRSNDGHFTIRRETALLIAAREGHTSVVAALLDRGANVHARGIMGRTALYYAQMGGWVDLQRTLEAKGAC